MIDLFAEFILARSVLYVLARYILIAAGIKPDECDCEEQCGCQYEIRSFGFDVVNGFTIQEGSKTHVIHCVRKP